MVCNNNNTNINNADELQHDHIPKRFCLITHLSGEFRC